MAISKIGSNGLNLTNSLALTGTTPSLTIGDAGAEDTKIVFDGNAQDYYIGLDDSADDLLIGLGSTVGTTPAISIDENLAITTAGDITMGGTTPTLTIGDAGAEDTMIVFDGNAQDYRIGLDDGTDTLEIGLGNAHGTTAHIITDANGIVRKPLQPAFSSKRISSGQTITSGTTAKIAFNSEVFDINADNATSTFTCPVDGRYLFSSAIQFGGIGTTNGGRMSLYIYKNDALYAELGRFTSISGAGLPFNEMSIVGAIVMDLDAADEVCLYLYNNSGATVTLNYGSDLYNSWSGCLL